MSKRRALQWTTSHAQRQTFLKMIRTIRFTCKPSDNVRFSTQIFTILKIILHPNCFAHVTGLNTSLSDHISYLIGTLSMLQFRYRFTDNEHGPFIRDRILPRAPFSHFSILGRRQQTASRKNPSKDVSWLGFLQRHGSRKSAKAVSLTSTKE
jgi:hypothetical protein